MGKITYTLSTFNPNQAKQGALVVAVTSTYSANTISNITKTGSTWAKTTNFLGAGVCKIRGSIFALTVDSIDYEFNASGLQINSNAHTYTLKMGTVTDDNLVYAGNTVKSTTTNRTTRSAGTDPDTYSDSTSIDDNSNNNVVIDSMNVRDQFAVQALRSILAQVPDPSTVNNSVMGYYCEAAYQWAANMMAAAANARATLDDTTASGQWTDVEVGSFENNTEKLLNNIWAALVRTDAPMQSNTGCWKKTGETDVIGPYTDAEAQQLGNYQTITQAEADGWSWSSDLYAERITNPEEMKVFNEYYKHTPVDAQDTQKYIRLEEFLTLLKDCLKHTPTGPGDTQVMVGLEDLINAIKGNQTVVVSALPEINIGNHGLGRDSLNPIYVSGGEFPTRSALAAALVAADIHDLLAFNADGAVGYSTLAETKKAILGYLDNYADLSALYAALQPSIDARIQAWLNAARVNVGGTDYSITVNTPT